MTNKEIVLNSLHILLGLFFMFSGLAKYWSLSSFADVLQGYSFLPTMIILPLTYGIPGMEIFLGAFLCSGYRIHETSIVLLFLVFIFTVAAFINYQNGQITNCGCFGGLIERKNNWRLYAGNTLLISLLHFVFLQENSYTE